jgi:hypothetical protein
MGAENEANKNLQNEEKNDLSSSQNIPIEPSNPTMQDDNAQNDQPNLNINNNNSNLQNNGNNQFQSNPPNSQIMSNQQSIPSQNQIIPPPYIPPNFSQGYHIQRQSQYTQSFPSQYTQNTDLSLYIKNPQNQFYGTNQDSYYTSTMSAQYFPSQNNNQQIPYNSQFPSYQYQPQSQFIQSGSIYEQPKNGQSEFIQSGSIYEQPKNGQSEFIQSGSIYETPKEGSLEYQSNQFQNLQNMEPKESYKDPFDIKESEEVKLPSQGEAQTSHNNQLDVQNTQNIKENKNDNNGIQNENIGNNENGLLGSTVLETQLLGNEQKQNQDQNEINSPIMSQFGTLKISKTRYLTDEEVNNINNNENNNNENKNNDIKVLPPKDLGIVTNQVKYLSPDQLKDINNYYDTKSGEIIQSKNNFTEDQWKQYYPSSQLGETVYNTTYIENNVNSINNNIVNVDAKNNISNIFGGDNVASTINIGDKNNNVNNTDIFGGDNVASTINIGDTNQKSASNLDKTNNIVNSNQPNGNNLDEGNNNINNNLIGTNILGNNEFVKMSKTQYVKEDSDINNDEKKNNLKNNESKGEVPFDQDTEQKENLPIQKPKVIIIEDEEDIQICPNMVSSFLKKLFG